MRKLNPDQIAASKPVGGISLVIAGAGTGKTSTMVSKIQNVIEHSIVKPEQILILTFSRKAAAEIRERLSPVLNSETESGFAGTFHSFSLKLLKEYREYYFNYRGITSFPSVISSTDKEIVIKKLIMEKPERFLGLPADIVMNLSEKINCLSGNTIRKLKESPIFKEIMNLNIMFEKYKNEKQLIEFEDMVNHASDLLEYFPELKKNLSGKYRYIFIDEFQDTSENNFRLLSNILPEKNINLFMVGDDFQSIYKFRHSRIEYIVNAGKFFPGITIFKLKINYRSNKEILKVSNRFIRLNKFRTSKKISSFKGAGGKIKLYRASDLNEEAEVLKKIILSIPGKFSTGVLYRNNYQGDYLKQKVGHECSSKNIQFMTMHGSKGLEFDIVIIAGISDKIIPDRTTDLEEERRLFYVALTRAKSELHLIYYLNTTDEYPRFIKEIGYRKK